MGEVAITINGRTYRLGAEPGQEPRLRALADHVRAKVAELSAQFGHAGDERLLLMAAMTIADELLDARALLDAATDPGEPEAGPAAEPSLTDVSARPRRRPSAA